MISMPRKAALVVAAVLAVAAAGAALFAAATAPQPESAVRPRAGTDVASPRPDGSAPAPSRAGGRTAAGLSVDEALRRLDLIKPARQKAADDFTLPTLDGGTFRLADQRGKVVLVNFWATWCPPCLEEMPAMQRLWARHKDAGFVLVAVSLDADSKKVPPFVKAHGLAFSIALDPKMEVADKYGVRALPSSFVVDRQGTMTGLALGPRHWDDANAHGLVQAMLR
jgi:peroxiredoxin